MHVNYCDMDWHLKYIQLPNDEASFLAYLEESKSKITQNNIFENEHTVTITCNIGQNIIV